MPSLLTPIPAALPDELVEMLVQASGARIERIVSHGHVSPPGFWYDQEEHEFVLLIQGSARLRLEREVVTMNPGDWIEIQARRKHRVEWTAPDQPTIWLAVFYR